MNKKYIPAIVIKVIDKYTIVINAGSEHGVTTGQRFLIYSLSEDDIIDPVTGDNLGKLEILKGTGTATHVQGRMTTITSDQYKRLPSKRIIRKKSFGAFTPQDEIVEDQEPKHLPFDYPSNGDYAKPI